jgi:hypothetical protein
LDRGRCRYGMCFVGRPFLGGRPKGLGASISTAAACLNRGVPRRFEGIRTARARTFRLSQPSSPFISQRSSCAASDLLFGNVRSPRTPHKRGQVGVCCPYYLE